MASKNLNVIVIVMNILSNPSPIQCNANDDEGDGMGVDGNCVDGEENDKV